MSATATPRIRAMTLASVYPLYRAKVEKKGRTKAELDTVICWLTGYDEPELGRQLAAGATFEDFFDGARMNPNASLITGVICGVRVEAIEDPLMQQIRYLDKLVDELAKGRPSRRCFGAERLAGAGFDRSGRETSIPDLRHAVAIRNRRLDRDGAPNVGDSRRAPR